MDSAPILVTGSHRSGTTWVGNCIAASAKVQYVQEPFNIEHKPLGYCNPFKAWFQYIDKTNESEFISELDKIVFYRSSLSDYLTRTTGVKDNIKALLSYLEMKTNKYTRKRPLLKDPIAFFSAEWLSSNYKTQNLVVIRHPAAFISSLKIKNWQFNFNDFYSQPALMKAHLSCYETEIENAAKNKHLDIIDQGILLWNCIHNTVINYQNKYPEWIFITHEQLSSSPTQEFEKIYEKLGLSFTNECRKVIEDSSGQHNPKEQKASNEFVRNSAENIYNWKSRLTDEEISRIKHGTNHISKYFYDESQW